MAKNTTINVGTCVNCNELNFPSRKCLKSVIRGTIELKEALMPRNCNYFSSSSFFEDKWNWKNGLDLGNQRSISDNAIVTLILIIPLILASFINIIVIREILLFMPFLLFMVLLISLRGSFDSIEKRQTLSKKAVWQEAIVRVLGLLIVIVTALNIYNIVDDSSFPSLVLILFTLFIILNYLSKYPVPLNKYFPEINQEFYNTVQAITKKNPWRIFIPLNKYQEDKSHPLFLSFALNSLEDLDEEFSFPIIRFIGENYWEEIFPEVIKFLLVDGQKKAPVGAIVLLAQKKEEPEVLDFIIDIPTMTIPLKRMNLYIETLLSKGYVDLRRLINRLGGKTIVAEEMWGRMLAIKPSESRDILNEEIKKSEGVKKERYEKILEYLEKTEDQISKKESGRPDISSAKTDFEIAIKEAQKEDYQSSITHLNAIVSKYSKSSEVKLLAYSLLCTCYVQLSDYEKAYSFTKTLFSSASYEPKFEDYKNKLLCEIELKISSEVKATMKEIREKFPNYPELDDPRMQLMVEMVSTKTDSRESSSFESPDPEGFTTKQIPREEVFHRVQQTFKSMLTDDREKNIELSTYFYSVGTMMNVTVGSENEEHKRAGTMIVREGKILHVSDETFLNLTKACGSLVMFSEFNDAYDQINVAFQDEKYIPAAEDYLVKIICEI